MNNQYILTPFFLDQPRDALRSLAGPDWMLNAPALPQGDVQPRMSVVHEALAGQVAHALRAGTRPVSIAGDCCATIGVVAGLQRAGVNPVVVWLDAHGDFNTWETTPSGFLGGMPLAMLVGRGEQTMPNAVGVKTLDEERILLTDARDLDAGERISLESSRVHHIGDLNAVLANDLMNAPLYVHFDTDIVNPDDAPAQSWATPGGPSAAVMSDFFRALSGKNIIAISVCAWNPALDTDGRTEQVSLALLKLLIGES